MLIILHAEHLDPPQLDHASSDTGHDIAVLMALFYNIMSLQALSNVA
jgi:hypothetical protein